MRDVLGVAVLSLLVVACDYQRPADVLEPFDAPVSSVCGDGIVSGSEGCDDGNAIDGDGCDSNCTFTACGNGRVTAGEFCDDGNAIDGDGCDSNCHTGCGVGVRAGGETCDDGNLTCGTCNSSCSLFAEGRAAGSIHVLKAADLNDGETFILKDGFNPPVVFEFNKTGGVTTGNIAVNISLSETVSGVALEVYDVIDAIAGRNTVPLLEIVPTSLSGSIVNLRHKRFTAQGNQTVAETVNDDAFLVTGMIGGAGGDCAAGQPCRSNNDCRTNICTNKVCQ